MYKLMWIVIFCMVSLNNKNTVTETIQCDTNRTIYLELIKGYYKIEQQYEEGSFTTFTYSDSSYVLLLCGKMVNLPILSGMKYQMINRRETELYNSRFGFNAENNKYWREDNYNNGITILYDNVTFSKTKVYDLILDSIKIR